MPGTRLSRNEVLESRDLLNAAGGGDVGESAKVESMIAGTRLGGERGGIQIAQAAASNASGAVLLWSDSADWGLASAALFAQRYDSQGAVIGDPILVGGVAAVDTDAADVALESDGDFLVVWDGYSMSSSGRRIHAQRFDASGARQGETVRVNDNRILASADPSVAIDPQGGFFAVWAESDRDGDRSGIFGRRFDASDTPLSPDQQINTTSVNTQYLPDVAIAADGTALVVFFGAHPAPTDPAVQGRFFDPEGLPLGDDFYISTDYFPLRPMVSLDTSGDFLVTWTRQDFNASAWALVLTRFRDAGSPGERTEILINGYVRESLPAPPLFAYDLISLAADRVGLAWSGTKEPISSGPLRFHVFLTVVDTAQRRVLDEFQISPGNVRATSPALAMLDGERFLAAWTETDGIPFSRAEVRTRVAEFGATSVLALRAFTPDPTIIQQGSAHHVPPDEVELEFSKRLADSSQLVEHLMVTVDGVTIAREDLELTVTDTARGRTVARFRLGHRAGTIRITVSDQVQGAGGVPLDGDGDGVAGGDYSLTFSAIVGFPRVVTVEVVTDRGTVLLPSVDAEPMVDGVIKSLRVRIQSRDLLIAYPFDTIVRLTIDGESHSVPWRIAPPPSSEFWFRIDSLSPEFNDHWLEVEGPFGRAREVQLQIRPQLYDDSLIPLDGDEDGFPGGTLLRRFQTPPYHPADINSDRNVGLGDYAVWVAQLGQTGTAILADINRDGSVGLADYLLWAVSASRPVAVTSVSDANELAPTGGGRSRVGKALPALAVDQVHHVGGQQHASLPSLPKGGLWSRTRR